MKQWKWIFSAVVAVVVVLPLLVYGAGWLLSFRVSGETELPVEAVLARAGEIEVGAPVAGSVEFTLPLCRSIDSAELKPGEGSLAVGGVRIERTGWHFTRRTWRISFELCALRDGAVKAGVLELELSGDPPERGEIKIPGFTAVLTPPEPGTELELAGAIELPQKSNRIWWIAAGAVAAIVVIVLLLLRRRRAPKLSLPERTLALLAELALESKAGRISPEEGVAKLTDLIRGYLEERFGIQVSTRTTPEFLADFDRDGSELPESERPFLREFLEAADRVKFAALAPEAGLLEQAIESARKLVESTRPADPKGGAK
ncbi:hypothetical protein [uncultured Victivallis sp.]|uniref:hypothetical protein n=1 Tax=uncultured Victivallis sp. TaxID=354118 RepID=UPI0025D9777D|nr:hypothetical protein [uncultured Victivallis sp.]